VPIFAALTALLSLSEGTARGADDTALAQPEAVASTTAVVVLIGDAVNGAELEAVLAELLERQGVHPEFVSQERFDPGALLSEGEEDSRSWVFIVLRGEHAARLYFRGPLGKRFLLRELSLRSGLDEVGRESIAQVVETSTGALLHSTAGISRDEASASILRERTEPARTPPSPRTTPKAATERRPATLEVALGARGGLLWNRSDPAAAVGGEGALGLRVARAFVARTRVAVEYRASQTIATPDVSVSFGSVALRGGVDGGFFTGPHAVFLGLGAGVDFDHVSSSAGRDRSLSLAPASDDTTAVLRCELRYELALGKLWLAASAFSDFATVRTHYDVARAGGTTRIGELWSVRPGLSLTVGFTNASVSRTRDTGLK
jgi:hypothetical protein